MSFFRSEWREQTLIVSIDRPPLNALTAELLEEGAALLERLADEPPAGGFVVTGTGSAFTAGVDTAVVAQADRAARQRLLVGINSFAAALYRLPCAVVAAVNGHAVGAGGIMCLAADWVVAADVAAKIGLPEAKAGLPFPAVPQIIIDHALDPVWRRRLALSSRLYSPHQAVASGLVDEVVDAERLIDTACTRATDMAAQPGFAAVKSALKRRAMAEIDAALGG